jgi:hypothetical protein
MRNALSVLASCLCALLLAGCPVKETCADGFVASGDDCIPASAADLGLDAGVDLGADLGSDAGPPDAGPCGGACTGATPVCDVASNRCVQCTAADDAACAGETPVCDTASNTCVQCTAADDAACSGATPVCDPASNACVACLADADCPSLAAPQCDTASNTCVACTASAACSGRSGTTVCNTASGACVACTAADRTACGMNVCDGATNTCTTFAAGSAGLCQPCVADAQCAEGQLCVPTTFGSTMASAGKFCLWRLDAMAMGAPAGDCFTTCASSWRRASTASPRRCAASRSRRALRSTPTAPRTV